MSNNKWWWSSEKTKRQRVVGCCWKCWWWWWVSHCVRQRLATNLTDTTRDNEMWKQQQQQCWEQVVSLRFRQDQFWHPKLRESLNELYEEKEKERASYDKVKCRSRRCTKTLAELAASAADNSRPLFDLGRCALLPLSGSELPIQRRRRRRRQPLSMALHYKVVKTKGATNQLGLKSKKQLSHSQCRHRRQKMCRHLVSSSSSSSSSSPSSPLLIN